MSAETRVLADFFSAINRFDMQAIVRDFDPDILRVEPEGHATSGIYRGVADVRAHIGKGRGTWAEGSCDPEKFLQNGEKVVVYLHARVRKNGSTKWMGGRFADGFVIRDGRIVEYRTFWERVEALEWAGIVDPELEAKTG